MGPFYSVDLTISPYIYSLAVLIAYPLFSRSGHLNSHAILREEIMYKYIVYSIIFLSSGRQSTGDIDVREREKERERERERERESIKMALVCIWITFNYFHYYRQYYIY